MMRKNEIPLFPKVFRFFPSAIFFSSPHFLISLSSRTH